MHFMLTLCLVVALAALGRSKTTETELVTIEHSFDGKTYSPRGRNALQFRNEKYIASEAETAEGMDEFKRLLDSNGLYHIRARFSSEDGNHVTTAALPACDLQRSGFREDITLHLHTSQDAAVDGSGGSVPRRRVVGLSYSSPVLALARPCDSSKLTSFPKFQTKVHVGDSKALPALPLAVQGPRPPILQKVNLGSGTDADGGAAEGAAAQGQQSILRKYWYIVLPMVLFVMFGGGGEEPKKDGAAGEAGAAAAAAPAAAK